MTTWAAWQGISSRDTLISEVRGGKLTVELYNNALQGVVTAADLTIAADLSIFPCPPNMMYNSVTRVCCPSQSVTMVSDQTTAAKARWDADGCTVTSCNKGYHLYKGKCLTCMELNPMLSEPRFLPTDAEWIEGQLDCSQWRCLTGFVPSISGYSCVSMALLIQT